MPLCLPLDAAEATPHLVGGKGASLAKLAVAGLPVPPGYHITTTAYRRFVAFNDLQAAITAATSGATADDPAALEAASASIRALFERGAITAASATLR